MPMKLKVIGALILLSVVILAAHPVAAESISTTIEVSGLVPPPPPTPAFKIITTCGSRAVSFIDQSADATSYSWNFGDLTAPSTVQNPSHPYSNPGTYTVTLTATGPGGQTSVSHPVTVPPPCAGFKIGTTCGVLKVTLTDQSSGTIKSYLWNFGDGITSTVKGSTDHTYTGANTYTVTLTLTAEDGTTSTATQTVTVPPQPVAAFKVSCDGCGKYSVKFTDQSSGCINSYAWNFGDGKTSTTKGSTSHTYSKGGTYTVTLKVSGSGGVSATVTKLVTVPPVCAGFKVSTACGSLTATFTDASSGTINSYAWSFGDGTGATGKGPVSHPYASPGSYPVTLTLTGKDGSVSTATQTVRVCSKITAASSVTQLLPLTDHKVQSTGTTTSGNPASWAWTFCDSKKKCGTSTSQSPSYKFASATTSTITLTVKDACGCSNSVSKSVAVK
jgi:PKD repeat protein